MSTPAKLLLPRGRPRGGRCGVPRPPLRRRKRPPGLPGGPRRRDQRRRAEHDARGGSRRRPGRPGRGPERRRGRHRSARRGRTLRCRHGGLRRRRHRVASTRFEGAPSGQLVVVERSALGEGTMGELAHRAASEAPTEARFDLSPDGRARIQVPAGFVSPVLALTDRNWYAPNPIELTDVSSGAVELEVRRGACLVLRPTVSQGELGDPDRLGLQHAPRGRRPPRLRPGRRRGDPRSRARPPPRPGPSPPRPRPTTAP